MNPRTKTHTQREAEKEEREPEMAAVLGNMPRFNHGTETSQKVLQGGGG
jgi:hypothetical protein